MNGTVKPSHRFHIGGLRTMECGLFSNSAIPDIPAMISMQDFRGCRTAMFGKTRLGKSNVVKLIAQGMLDATATDNSVGQLIFDVNGEYANDNPQDGNRSIRSSNEARSQVYALAQRPGTPSRPLRLNFYEQPDSCIQVIKSMLEQDNKTSIYVRAFGSVSLPAISSIAGMNEGEKTRAIRKVQLYWSILHKAGFRADETRLRSAGPTSRNARGFNPGFKKSLRDAMLPASGGSTPPEPSNLAGLASEFEAVANFRRANPGSSELMSTSGNPLFDAEDGHMLDFLAPASGAGPTILAPYASYHDAKAGDFIVEILQMLDVGKVVILDLGNATDELRRYFADMLSRAVFGHQERKFVENRLNDHFVQLYFEEAHNLFPVNDKDLTGVYARFAKEGAKFHIGMVYSTQSPSTINRELLAQTENFFVGHLSSQDEAKALARVQIAFDGHEQDVLRSRTPGFMRMITLSHRFVVPIQAKKYEAVGTNP